MTAKDIAEKVKKVHFKIVSVIIALVSFAGWRVYNTPQETNKSSEINQALDCGTETQCFYEAHINDCTASKVYTNRTTIEGDPIYNSASMLAENGDCSIKVTKDGTQDKYGDGKVHTYVCKTVGGPNQYLLPIGGCVESGSSEVLDIGI